MARTKYKPDFARLNGSYRQAKLSYDACIQAMRNGNHKEAVKLQLLAIDSLNEFNEILLQELEWMRKPPKKTWVD